MKNFRIIEHVYDPPSFYWRLYRDADGRVLEYDTEEEARDMLHLLRDGIDGGRFRIHRGALTMANIRAQGHRIRPPKDLLLQVIRAAQSR